MFKKLTDLLQGLKELIQSWAPTVQTIIAAFMLWTLVQNAQTLSTTQRQLESSIEPVVDAQVYGSTIKLTNSGSIDIRKLKQFGVIAGTFELATRKITAHQISYRDPLLLIGCSQARRSSSILPG